MGTKNNFHRHISDKRKIRVTMTSVWKETLDVITQVTEKAELLQYFFSIGFHQQVLQPYWLSHRRQKQGLGK